MFQIFSILISIFLYFYRNFYVHEFEKQNLSAIKVKNENILRLIIEQIFSNYDYPHHHSNVANILQYMPPIHRQDIHLQPHISSNNNHCSAENYNPHQRSTFTFYPFSCNKSHLSLFQQTFMGVTLQTHSNKNILSTFIFEYIKWNSHR